MTARPDTKTRILDAVEKLFGEKGFDATSLRDITAEADVNLAAVNYHFQSKDSLIDAAILRRATPVNSARIARLEAAGPHPTLEQIIEAFIGPVLEMHEESMEMMMTRVFSAPDVMQRVFRDHMSILVRRFMDALAVVLPDLPEAERMWRLQFTAGAMAHAVTRSRILQETFGLDVKGRGLMIARLVTFTAAGFRATEVH